MATYTLKNTPPTLGLIKWVADDPQRATRVGVSLIGLGVAILILAAIFRS